MQPSWQSRFVNDSVTPPVAAACCRRSPACVNADFPESSNLLGSSKTTSTCRSGKIKSPLRRGYDEHFVKITEADATHQLGDGREPAITIGLVILPIDGIHLGYKHVCTFRQVQKKTHRNFEQYWAILIEPFSLTSASMDIHMIDEDAIPNIVFLIDFIRRLGRLHQAPALNKTSRQ